MAVGQVSKTIRKGTEEMVGTGKKKGGEGIHFSTPIMGEILR